ncbi:MAG: glycosyltransferase family 4 protein [bacterium]|nr:glycosyltransferase family 4 protein [bacterium]
MKILQLFNRFPWPLKDGGAIANYNESKGYHEAGVELTMAALNTEKHFIEFHSLPPHVQNMAQIHLTYIDNRIKPQDALLNLFSKRSYHVDRFICDAFEKQLVEICETNTFDVIVFESVFVAPYLAAIRQHSKAVCVLRQHNIEYKIWENLAQNDGNIIKRSYLRLLASRLKKYEVSVLNQFDGITVFTQTDADMLRHDNCQMPIGIYPFGINLDKLVINQTNLEMPSLFHLGSMDWLPNQEAMNWFIQEVWYDVSMEFPSLHFYLAGRNIPLNFFDYNNQSNIRVLGEVDDAIRLMNEKAIMIVPLFSGSGIRVKILEGMALGKCIVSTNLGAQGINVVDGEHILIANTAEEFKEKIAYLIKHPTEVKRIGNNAAALARTQYDNKKIITEKLNFYRQLVPKN